MAHDVFVSYSSQDKPTAEAICHALEAEGVRCWVAHRDARPGRLYQGSIVRAIRDCRAMVLVFSDGANASAHVTREVAIASDANKPVVPFRVEEAEMSDELYYYISSVHWLDALTPPLEHHIERLVQAIKTLHPHRPIGVPEVEEQETTGSEAGAPEVEESAAGGPKAEVAEEEREVEDGASDESDVAKAGRLKPPSETLGERRHAGSEQRPGLGPPAPRTAARPELSVRIAGRDKSEPLSEDVPDSSRRRFLAWLGAGIIGLLAALLTLRNYKGSGASPVDELGASPRGRDGVAGDVSKAVAAQCEGYDALTQQDLQVRQSLGYVDESPNPEQRCSNCRFFFNQPEAGEVCGRCQLFPGPVAPRGYCNTWAALSYD